MNVREKVLKEALKCVNGEREKQYGNPEDNFSRIADFWGLYLTTLFEDTGVVVDLDPKDVAIMMILFKIARSLGDQDKLDNYVDIIGYAACGAEILERSEEDSKKVKEWVDKVDAAEGCTVCGKKDKPDEKCNRNECGQFDACMTAYQHYIYNKAKEASETIDKYMFNQKNPYSYYHDKLANYVSVKAKEENIPLANLKSVNRKLPRELEELLDQAATDCVMNGKKVIDCYKEIDELFKKYRHDKDIKDKEKKLFDDIRKLYGLDDDVCVAIVKSDALDGPVVVTDEKKNDKKKYNYFWEAYNNISEYIASSSSKEKVHIINVVDRLTKNGHAPTEMAALLWAGKLGFNDVASYIEDAINEVKKDNKDASSN